MYLFTQVWLVVTSFTWVTTGAGPVQLSLVVTLAIFGAGTWNAHVTVMLAGHAIVGGVLSNTVITCTHVDELPQSSVER